MATIKSILGKLFVNDKQIVVLDDTAENGAIESGSNANGSYTKFPDGILIQWGEVTISPTTNIGGEHHTYPIPFVGTSFANANPMETWSSSNGGSPATNCYSNSTTNMFLKCLSLTNGGALSYPADGLIMQWNAIGRWK